jgi:serine/threonine-protein kinase HipA
VSEQNDFALLWALGGECAGAVILLPEGQNPAANNDYVPLNEDTLHEIIASLPKHPHGTILSGDWYQVENGFFGVTWDG